MHGGAQGLRYSPCNGTDADTAGSERFIILTAGNETRGDDGAGPLFGRLLKGIHGVHIVAGGMAPENCLGRVARIVDDAGRKCRVLVVDAMDFGGQPGDMLVALPDSLDADILSTHGTSHLALVFLGRLTGCAIHILGIQPERSVAGEAMSPAVRTAVENAAAGCREEGIDRFLQRLPVREGM